VARDSSPSAIRRCAPPLHEDFSPVYEPNMTHISPSTASFAT
jgi:hypothetical protein